MLYTLDEAAALLRVSTWTLREMIRKNKVPVIKMGPHTRRIDSKELQAFIDAHSPKKVAQ